MLGSVKSIAETVKMISKSVKVCHVFEKNVCRGIRGLKEHEKANMKVHVKVAIREKKKKVERKSKEEKENKERRVRENKNEKREGK